MDKPPGIWGKSCYDGRMNRRTFLQTGLGIGLGTPLFAAMTKNDFSRNKLNAAAEVLSTAASSGQVHAAALYVQQGDRVFERSFGAAKSIDDIFLLASISKPISAAAVMKLYDEQKFGLDDPVQKFIPNFTGEGREKITMRQLLTHVSGLPDQLPQNAELRARHAKLSEFVAGAIKTPLLFAPGSRYSYSSMAILLAAEAAQRISGTDFPTLVDQTVYRPLEMKRSAMGLGRLKLESLIRCQVKNAAPEAGAGNEDTKDWDHNSPYWRKLGAPWGGAHGSAPEVARFLAEFLHPGGTIFRKETERLMLSNHNPDGVRPHGLGFRIGTRAGSPGCSEKTFGHTGSTGTLCWADPATDTICVVLTTLPAQAADPHPRNVTSDRVAQAVS